MTNENGKLLGHGTSKLMVCRNKQTINDAVKYVCEDKLPQKYITVWYIVFYNIKSWVIWMTYNILEISDNPVKKGNVKIFIKK